MDPCKDKACAIQDCLKRTNYNESKCTEAIDALYACCKDFYKKNSNEARTTCCPIPRLLDFKIQQRKQEQLDAKLI